MAKIGPKEAQRRILREMGYDSLSARVIVDNPEKAKNYTWLVGVVGVMRDQRAERKRDQTRNRVQKLRAKRKKK